MPSNWQVLGFGGEEELSSSKPTPKGHISKPSFQFLFPSAVDGLYMEHDSSAS